LSRDVIVFDLDDTLYLERDYVRSGFAAAAAWLDDELGAAGFFDAAWKLFEAGVRGDVFDRALVQLGYPNDPQLVSRLVSVYRSHTPTLGLLPDACEVLPRLGADFTLALLTDGYVDVQRRKVASLGIASRFVLLVYSDALGGREVWKPSPVPYEHVMAKLGCDGSRCTYVADNPSKDFITAKRLGWFTLRIRRELGEYARVEADASQEAAHTMDSLLEIPKYLAHSSVVGDRTTPVE
jgi:putative hydrolase of the HAD superfamily